MVPVSHGEGRYVADAETVAMLEDTDRVAFRYGTTDGLVTPEANPNGALRVRHQAQHVAALGARLRAAARQRGRQRHLALRPRLGRGSGVRGILGTRCHMAQREFTVVVEEDEDGVLVGLVPELRGCYSQGRTLEELMERMKEVIQLCLEDETDDEPSMKLVGVHRLAV